MIEFVDEVLDPSLQPDTNPRYTIKDNNGKVINDDVQIELKTPVVNNGTQLNREFFLDIGFHAGMILMWSGSIDTIPKGWVLCNGQNGTPDLRNRFIVGAGSSYNVGATGGSNTVTLNISQIPSHNHGASSEEAGLHSHTYETVHPHSTAQGTGGFQSTVGDLDEYATTKDGTHTHKINIENTGGGGSHENRPPYYALAYIMKI